MVVLHDGSTLRAFVVGAFSGIRRQRVQTSCDNEHTFGHTGGGERRMRLASQSLTA